MSSRLANRIVQARRAYFVGREAERALFQSALEAADPPFYVLNVFGPGGVGKTSLLQEYMALCEDCATPYVYLDGRDMEPNPVLFQSVLALNLGLAPTTSPIDHLAQQDRRFVLMVDTFEQLAPLDRWLRVEFLPKLPETVLTVLAGQEPPPLTWRTDPGWLALVRNLPLRNLTPEEGRAYLARRDVPADQHDNILEFTYSYPLALSLVAEEFTQRRDTRFESDLASDVVHTLLERLVQKVPGPAHRAALEACAILRVTNEPLLAAMLSLPDARELFEWLRSLSFVSASRDGLFPHDLVRNALVADLRWRNPDWYRVLHTRARDYFSDRLEQTFGIDQQRVLVDYVFLHRDNPVLRPFLDWQMRDSRLLSDILRPDDPPQILAMVERHEGQESAALAAHWLDAQPQGFIVYRNEQDEAEGFLSMVAVEAATSEEQALDPAVKNVLHFAQTHAPLRPGERATLFRFWMHRQLYQAVSAVQSMAFISILQYYLTTPALALTFFACANPEFWTLLLAYANVTRLAETDFVVGDKHFGVYYHDWRIEPPLAWLAVMAARELTTGAPPPASQPQQTLLVLSQPDFAAALHDALRDYLRPDLLAQNPLVRSRLVTKQAGNQESLDARVAVLRTALKDATTALQSTPRDNKFYRALYHTYFQPAPTQEAAAELLDLPFSTYRRHLKSGIDRVAEILWHAELQSI